MGWSSPASPSELVEKTEKKRKVAHTCTCSTFIKLTHVHVHKHTYMYMYMYTQRKDE